MLIFSVRSLIIVEAGAICDAQSVIRQVLKLIFSVQRFIIVEAGLISGSQDKVLRLAYSQKLSYFLRRI